MPAWLTANPLFPLTCRPPFRNQLSSFEGHRNGLELSQSPPNSALAKCARARVVTKRVVHGEPFIWPRTFVPIGLRRTPRGRPPSVSFYAPSPRSPYFGRCLGWQLPGSIRPAREGARTLGGCWPVNCVKATPVNPGGERQRDNREFRPKTEGSGRRFSVRGSRATGREEILRLVSWP